MATTDIYRPSSRKETQEFSGDSRPADPLASLVDMLIKEININTSASLRHVHCNPFKDGVVFRFVFGEDVYAIISYNPGEDNNEASKIPPNQAYLADIMMDNLGGRYDYHCRGENIHFFKK